MASWKAELIDDNAHGGGIYCDGILTTGCTSNDGNFKFKSPDSEKNRYKITYTADDGKTATTEYTVEAGQCVICDCSKTKFTKNTTQPTKDRHTYTFGNIAFTNNFCANGGYSFAASVDNYATGVNVGSDGNITGTVEANGTAASRNIKLTVNLMQGSEVVGTCVNGEVYTQPGDCKCENAFNYNGTTPVSIPAAGVNSLTLGTVTMNGECAQSIVTISGSNYVTKNSSGVVSATIPANTQGEQTFKYGLVVNGASTLCKGPYELKQAAGCNCDKYHFEKAANIPFPTTEPTPTTYTAILGALSSDNGCSLSNIKFSSVDNKITNMGLNGSTLTGTVSWTQEEIDRGPSPVDLTFKLHYLDASSEACSSFTITQLGEERVCLADNCSDDDLFTNKYANLHIVHGALCEGSDYGCGCDSTRYTDPMNSYKIVDEILYLDVPATVNNYITMPSIAGSDINNWKKASEVADNDNWLKAWIGVDGGCPGIPGTAHCQGHTTCIANGSSKIKIRNPKNGYIRWGMFHLEWVSENAWLNANPCDCGYTQKHYKKDSYVFIAVAPKGYKLNGHSYTQGEILPTGWTHDGDKVYDNYGRHMYKLESGYPTCAGGDGCTSDPKEPTKWGNLP